ncbi:MAG: hypothetical protein IPK26_13340 [Planctomycetes bacterium]|nr:hypothetical protein [Planctomycetota bacterium]
MVPAAFALGATLLPAQTQWLAANPGTSPAPRGNRAMAYDSTRGRVVLFSGYAIPVSAETWEWDGANWALVTAASAPAARINHALAFDFARSLVVLFGGDTGGGTCQGDTWTWDGAVWVQRSPATSPSPRNQHAMGGAPGDRLVMFGGHDGSSVVADTWEWDGTDWTLRNPANSPSARYAHAMAYDSGRGRSVLFGGDSGPGFLLAETWEWDGSNWIRAIPVVAPGPRVNFAMAFDSARSRIVLFGGQSPVGLLADTWEWDGSTWIQRLTPMTPQARRVAGLAFDTSRGRTVIFGGQGAGSLLGDTWEYGPVHPAAYVATGSGCSAAAATPVLAATASAPLPWLGSTFTLRVTQLPVGAQFAPFLVLGFSNPNRPLPWLPCVQRVDGEAFLVPASGGAAGFDLNIPADPAILGTMFHAQVAVLDAVGQPLLHALSNGMMGTVGGR